MKFKECSVNGVSYGIEKSMTKEQLQKLPKVTNCDFTDNSFYQDLQNKDEENHEFVNEYLLFLALCHTIITEKNEQGKLEYNASSPDELALLNFAKFMGYEFIGIDENNFMKVVIKGEIKEYELLHVLEFNSERKRMSVIIRDENK